LARHMAVVAGGGLEREVRGLRADVHMAGLRKDGVSCIFARERDLDLRLALEILHRELGVKCLLLKGGDGANGAFL
jgi:riboflavin biosynthesis pyrimidine reductase